MSRPDSLQETIPGFWRILRRFAPYLRKQKPLVAGSFVALFAEVGFRLLEPWPLKFVFDRVIPTGTAAPSSGIPLLDSLDVSTLLLVCAVGIVVITGLRALAAYFNTVGFAMLGNSVLSQVRSEVYNSVQRLSLSFHTKARSGDLVVRIIGDVSQLKDVAVTAMLPMLANVLILIGMLALMLLLQWQLTLLALVTVPLFALSTVRLSRRIREAARTQRKREGAMAATASESISAIKVVQALSLEDKLAESFFSQNKKSLKQDVKTSKLSASLERTVDVLIAVATGLVLWQGANLVLQGVLTAGDLLVFLTYLKNGFKPVRDFAKYTGRLAKATAAGERVMDVLEREPDVRNMPGAEPAPALRGAVRFDNVGFEYEPGHPVLRDISLDVRPGQHVAVIGASGNGKSTMLSLILRLYDPTTGRVMLDGRDVREYTIESVRSQISVVMQDTILFAASVRDNIAYGTPDATDEEIEAAARLANAHDFIMALPEGYDTEIGERGATLSNGQRQRISIARAAIRRAPIVILDEPTTGLDEENERAVMEALDRLGRGRTTFLVTHKLSQARNAETIVVLEDGRIVEQGTHPELMSAGGVYRKLYTGESLAGYGKELPATSPAAEPAPASAPVHLVVSGAEANSTDRLHTEVGQTHESQVESANKLKTQAYNPASSSEPRKSRLLSVPRALMLGLAILIIAIAAAAVNANAKSGGGASDTRIAAQAVQVETATTLPVRQPVPTAMAAMLTHIEARAGGTGIETTNVVTYSGYLTGVASLAWSPDNRTLALGSTDDLARLLDTQTGKVSLLKGHTKDVYAVAWSPDGSRLATGGFDNRVRVWNAEGQLLSTHSDHFGIIAGLTWLQDGHNLASVSTNMQIIQWDAETGSQVFAANGEGDLLYNVKWSPDGSTLAAGHADKTVRVWSRDGKLLSTMRGHTDEIYCAAWSPDGKMLATGANDDTVRLWSADGKTVATLRGHTDFINGVVWSPDGKKLASGAFDNTVRVWNSDGTELSILATDSGVLAVAWSPDGKSLAAVLKDGTVWLWKLG